MRCYKVAAATEGITYRQALDEALCTGWIDGVRHALDAKSFSQRFSPRRAGSEWSAVNIRRYDELLKQGRVRPAGARAFAARVKSQYSFESRPKQLAPAFVRRFRAKPRAWAFFEAQPPWYRRTSSFYVMSAKREETRERRLQNLIAACERAEGLSPVMPAPRPAPKAAPPARPKRRTRNGPR